MDAPDLTLDAVSEECRTDRWSLAFYGCLSISVLLTWCWREEWPSDGASWYPLGVFALNALAITCGVEFLRRLLLTMVAALTLWRRKRAKGTSSHIRALLRHSWRDLFFLLPPGVASVYQSLSLPDSLDLVLYFGLLPAFAIVFPRLIESRLESNRRRLLVGRDVIGDGLACNLFFNFLRPTADKLSDNSFAIIGERDELPLSEEEKVIYVLVPTEQRDANAHRELNALGNPIGRIEQRRDHAGQQQRPFVLSYFRHPLHHDTRLIATHAAALSTLNDMRAHDGVAYTAAWAEREAGRLVRRLHQLCSEDHHNHNAHTRIKVCCYTGNGNSLREAL
jgi:hypothetical protein